MAVSNVELRVDARNAVRELKKTNDASKKLNDTLGTTERKAATATGNIQRMGMSFRTTLGSVVALTGAVTFFSRSLDVLGERQADAAALANGLRKLGRGTADLERLQKAADEFGKATLFDQEDFDRGFALLTSFQTIGVESYTRVAKAAADVAQVTKQDVNSSLLQLAKALQDPVRGLTALSRSGTTFTEQQKEQIKALVKSGKQFEAQQFILAEIEKQYGGAAEAAGSAGYAGAVDSLGESFRDFQEVLATAVEPAVIGVLNGFTELFKVFTGEADAATKLAVEITAVSVACVALTKAVNGLLATKLAAFLGTQIALMQAFGAKIYFVAAAQGALNAAITVGQGLLAALPVAAVTLAVVGLADALRQAATDQANFNTVLNTGTVKQLENALATEKANLALERRRQLQGRGEGRAADRSRIERSQQKIQELEAALAEGMLGGGVLPLDQPTPMPMPTPTPTPTLEKPKKDLAKATGRLNLDAISYLQTLEEIEKVEFERGKQIADLINAAEDAGKAFAEDFAERAANKTDVLKDALQGVGDVLGNQLMNVFDGLINKTVDFNDVLRSTLSQVGRLLMTAGLNQLAGPMGSPGILSFLGFGTRANGGPVASGRPYIVGERGPELFMPQQSGNIRSNEDMRQLMGRSPAASNASAMNFTFETTNIGGTEYVSREQLEAAMATTRRQAASDGAKRGMNMTLDRMQNSPRTRSRVGIS